MSEPTHPDVISRKPLRERLVESVPTGHYYSDGYVSSGGGGSSFKSATPVMRAANRDGSEAAVLLSVLEGKLRICRDYARAAERVDPDVLTMLTDMLEIVRGQRTDAADPS